MTPDDDDVLFAHERRCAIQLRERTVSASYCKREAHAGRRSRARRFRGSEIGVGVYVHESYTSVTAQSKAEQGAKDDAAVAAHKKKKRVSIRNTRNAARKGGRVDGHLDPVSRPSGWS